MEYKTIHKREGLSSTIGEIGIEIKLASSKTLDFKKKNISKAIYKAVEMILAEVQYEIKSNQPGTLKEIQDNFALTKLFEEPIYIEEIPNGYCSDWCCRDLPWFIVTTIIGRIKIGWRKRVIHIEWTETKNKIEAQKLFPDEDVTKYDRIIHAWSLEKAKEYIKTIIENKET
jgi:hypothetical protein